MKKLIALCAFALATSPLAMADDFAATKAKLEAAMKSSVRGDADTERDRNRKPIQTLEFFGFRDNMKVLELIPGGGWYTKLLAPTLKDNGTYYAAIGTSRIKERLADKDGFDKMQIVAEDSKLWREPDARFYSLAMSDFGVTDLDMVLTFRNYHNFNEAGRMTMNKAVFDALKPGGVYAVVDHTARHMEPERDTNRRRVDPVLAIKEIQQAGFEFVDYSTLHYRQDDELEYEVGARSVSGNTDRWTLMFRKPE